MNKLLRTFPDQLIRIVLVILFFVIAVICIRTFLVPSSLKEKGVHRVTAINNEMSLPMKFAGSDVCVECHDDIYDLKSKGFHTNLSCETCHDAAFEHAEDPDSGTPRIPEGRKLCSKCHAYNPSRPTGFPQIDPVLHNPTIPCAECHNPHDPKPAGKINDCKACHGEIYLTKSVSAHALVKCEDCHEVSSSHMEQPRLTKASVPINKSLCLKCHDKPSSKSNKSLDMASHGGKYLCWQCHYPHKPEVK